MKTVVQRLRAIFSAPGLPPLSGVAGVAHFGWSVRLGLMAVVAGCCCLGSVAHGGGGPENVAVIINADSQSSKAVANHYIKLRNIPATNVVYLRDISSTEKIDVNQFRQHILLPLLKVLNSRGVAGQIDYIAYSSDMPYEIDVSPDIGQARIPKILTSSASINGLTFLYEHVLAKDLGYLQLSVNRYMRRQRPPHGAKPITEDEQQSYAEALTLIGQRKWPKAAAILDDLCEAYPGFPALHYNLARCLALEKKTNAAVTALERAVDAGWSDAWTTKRDRGFAALLQDAAFQRLLARMATVTFDVQPSRGFHAQYKWNQAGEPSASDGRRYLLSTVLAVTSGRGNSLPEALQSLKRSAMADGRRPKGTFYFMRNGDVRSKARDGAFPSSVKALRKLGMQAEIVDGILPSRKLDVCGLMTGASDFDWAASRSLISPGAICEHFTSFGGVLRKGVGQTPLTEFIRHGAAGASGTVMEPYALRSKFPSPFMHVHYARGCSMAEAFYQSIEGPYQLLIVGDPICRPWADIPDIQVTGIRQGHTISGKVTLQPAYHRKDPDEVVIRRFEIFIDGRRLAACGPTGSFTFDSTQLADGYHEARVVAVRDDLIETQGNAAVPFIVNNHDRYLSLKLTDPETSVSFERRFTLRAEAEGAQSVRLLHNGREIGRIEGPSGKLEVDPDFLGQGPVQLQASAYYDDEPKQWVASPPVAIDVRPPAASSSTP